MRNGPSNVIFFSCRDKLKALVPQQPKLGLLVNFLISKILFEQNNEIYVVTTLKVVSDEPKLRFSYDLCLLVILKKTIL